MKRIIFSTLLLAHACFAAATYYIEPGTTSFGAGRGALSSRVTVSLTGVPAYQQRIFNYFDFSGQLNIAMPPGVSGTCTGAPCNIFTGDGGGARDTLNQLSPGFFWIDPIFAPNAGTSNAVSLFAHVAPPASDAPYATNASGGMRFVSDSNGYLVGMRFYKVAADTSTSTSGSITSDDGSQTLATVTFGYPANAVGWQTAYFSTPLAISAHTIYQSRLTGIIAYHPTGTQNLSYTNGPLHSIATYVNSNGSCDPSDSWPVNPNGTSSAGIIGCVDIRSDGTLLYAYAPANGFSSGNIGYSRWGNVEGCQCMIGGVGPGPYALINTRIEGSGNEWHHDDSGGAWSTRGDYYYYRDTFTSPTYTWLGSPDSDGNRYFSRQKLEWKGGNRIYIGGSVFENFWNDNVNSSLAISFSNLTIGVHDINFENNEVRHGPGVFNAAIGAYGSNSYLSAPPAVRERFANNLIWDIGPYAIQYAGSGDGWFIQGPAGAEDLIIDHNTILPMRGQEGVLFWMYNTRSEGVTITNNILPISSSYQGISGEHSCPQRNAEGAINCLWTNYLFQSNLLYPANWSVFDPIGLDKSGQINQTYSSNTQPSDIVSWYPTVSQTNYVPAWTDLNNAKWFKLNSFPTDSTHLATASNFHLRSDSPYISGGPYKGTDGKDVGLDADAFESAQGKVVLIGTPPNQITASTATIAFIAPDTQACPVDYKIYDAADPKLITGFTRVSDTGTDRVRAVSLASLSSKTTYMYRVNCAVEQPTGQFRTN